jgi:transposase InsO family protein
VTVAEKRKVVAMLHQEGYSIQAACKAAELPRSSYYYQAAEEDEQELLAAIEEIAGDFPTYGSRRVTQQLRRPPYKIHVNRKRVRRIMAEKNLLRPVKRAKKQTTDSQHPYPRYPNVVKDLEITMPDQAWVSDVTYIRLHKEFVYLAIIMDVFTRAIRGWCLSRNLDQALTLTALKTALKKRCPKIHHSDQGVQYAAHAYIDLLKEHQIEVSMASVGVAEENGYAERVIRTIKEEEVYLSEYIDFADASRQIGHFIEDTYMTKRIHSSLGYLTPVEFEDAYDLELKSSLPGSP